MPRVLPPLVALATALATPAAAQLPPANDADALASEMRLLASNPGDVNALMQAGELSTRLGDLSGAASLFARADRVDPRNGRVKAGMAAVLLHLERPGEALQYYNQAEGYGYPIARFAGERGLAYDLTGNQGRAQRDYRLAIANGAGDDETVRRYALSLGISGQKDAALQQLEPLLRRNDRGAWRARAFVLAMNGEGVAASGIAGTMMAPGQAQAMAPFFARLPALGAADRAFAVHFGEVRATPQRLADARLAPALPPLAPELVAVARAAPVALAAARLDKHKHGRKGEVQIVFAARSAVPALPSPPAYGARAPVQVAAVAPLSRAGAFAAPTIMPSQGAVALARATATVRPILPAYPVAAALGHGSAPVATARTLVAQPPVVAPLANPAAASPTRMVPAQEGPTREPPLVPFYRPGSLLPGYARVAPAGRAPVPPAVAVPGAAAPVAAASARPARELASTAQESSVSSASPAAQLAGSAGSSSAATAMTAPLAGLATVAAVPQAPVASVAAARPVTAAGGPGVPATAAPVARASDARESASLAPAAPASLTLANATPAGADAATATPEPPSAGFSAASVGVATDPIVDGEVAGVAVTPRAQPAPAPVAVEAPRPVPKPARLALPAREREPSVLRLAHADAAPTPRRSMTKVASETEAAVKPTASEEKTAKSGTRTRTRKLASDDSDAPAAKPKGGTAAASSDEDRPSHRAKRGSLELADADVAPAKRTHGGKTVADEGARLSHGKHGERELADADAAPSKKSRSSDKKNTADAEPASRHGKHSAAAGTSDQADEDATPTKHRAGDKTANAPRGKAAAEKKALAAKEAEDKKTAKSEPQRYWVQVAGGANEDDLGKAWKAARAKAPALAGKKGFTTPLRATNRVLAGPFKSDDEARAFVNTLKKQGVSGFPFTSESGQKVKRLDTK